MSLTQKLIRTAAKTQALAGLKQKVSSSLRETVYQASALNRLEDKIAPIQLKVEAAAPKRINLLIPEISFATFFGGYIAKFNLAQKLIDAGHQVRLVIVDACKIDETAWREMVAQYAGIEHIFDQVEVAYCFDRQQPLTVSPQDSVIATTWWTAHIAHDMTKTLGRDKFLYLIQEYESLTFPMGAYYAIAKQSYAFPHQALFSSPQLRDYFKREQLGIFGEDWGDEREAVPFENAILHFEPSELFQNRVDNHYKLLFYARPEAHAARNMFEVAYLALKNAIKAGHFDHANWVFHGIGSKHGDIELPKGHRLQMLGKFGLKEYKKRLLEYDLGLSLMYTPHPSLLPLEMAAAGMWMVSNECENKTQAEFNKLSSNMLAAAPTIEGATEKLAWAAAHCGDYDARLKGAKVNWASSWHETFNNEKIGLISQWLK